MPADRHQTASNWLERWLLAHGVAPAEMSDLVTRTRGRAARYPFPIDRLYPGALTWIDRAAPAVLIRTLRSAHTLDAAAFDRLEHALQNHESAHVRAMYALVRHAGLEALYPDEVPTPPTHPLQALEGRIREGTSHWGEDLDVIVIGTGAGGAPVAWSLSKSGLRVAMIEAGRLVLAETCEEAIENHYLDQAMVGSIVSGGMALVLSGSAVGGTTVINSGTSLRPLPERLAAWDAALGTSFADGSLEPWLDQAAEKIGVTVSGRETLSASSATIERGLAALERPGAHVLPRNAPDCHGAGRCCFGCPTGAKLSTDRAFLPEAIEAGALLFAGTRATAVRETEGGVEVFVTGRHGRRTLRARKLVIAGGALSSPLLIRANRLGSRWKEAGEGLRIHPAAKVFGMMPEPLRPHGIPQGIGYHAPELPRLTFEGAHTPPSATAPMLCVAGQRHRWWMERYDQLISFGAMCRDRHTGSVRAVTDRRSIRYGVHPEDARDLGAGMLLVAEMMFAAGAERVALPLTGLDAEIVGRDDLRRIRPEDFTPQRMIIGGFHAQGTAGMGRVVDNELRLMGCDSISVCDASVLPDSPGVNPQVTIMALALRCADRLANEL